jgi:hypothetical protein
MIITTPTRFYSKTLYKWTTHGENCRRCNNLDGMTKSLAEWANSVMPGFHPHCDCSLTPITETTSYTPIIFAKIPDSLLGLIRFSNLAYFILPQVWPKDLEEYMKVCFAPKWDQAVIQAQEDWNPQTMTYDKIIRNFGPMVEWIDGTYSPIPYVVPGPAFPALDEPAAPSPVLNPPSSGSAPKPKIQQKSYYGR